MVGLAEETWRLFAAMAPYLLFGFGCAGILHVLLPEEKVLRHLTGRRFGAFVKATLLGLPLPLCSCGVIPVAAHLRKMGASKGPVLAFIAATPTTGVDSIAATYSLMGGLFTLIRTAADFSAGLLAGFLVNIFDPDADSPGAASDQIPPPLPPTSHPLGSALHRAVNYGFVELVSYTTKWLVIGIIAGGVISYAVPSEWITTYLSNPFLAYAAVIVVAIPTYVCATGSIPIAAALVMKGLSPGAGLVFLVAGPATNTATMAFVGGQLGRRSLVIYLVSIAATSVAFGAGFDYFFMSAGEAMMISGHEMVMLPPLIHNTAAVLLLLLMLRTLIPKLAPPVGGMVFKVGGMTCGLCEKKVGDAVRGVAGVENVHVNRAKGEVRVLGAVDDQLITEAIRSAGYSAAPP